MKISFKIIIVFVILVYSNVSFSQNKSLYLKDTISYGRIFHSSSFSSISINNRLTFECWINPLMLNGPIIGKEGCWTIEKVNSGIWFKLQTYSPYIINLEVALQTWQHFALTFDGDLNECKVYINGVLKGTRTFISQDIQDLTSDIFIGRRYYSGNYTNSTSLIDDVRIWNLVKTQSEIQNSFQSTLNGSQTGLVANYKFDNIFNNSFTDSSPNQNNGILYGPYEVSSDVYTPGIFSSSIWSEKTRVSTAQTSSAYMSAPNNRTLWVLREYPFVNKTVDGGETWTVHTRPDTSGFSCWAIAAIDENICLITGSSSTATKVWKTVNGGVSWNEVFFQAPGFINSIKMMNENTGYMMGDPTGGRWSLWKTNNGGSTWDSSGLYLPQLAGEFSIVGNMFCKQDIGWVFYSTRSGYYKSTDFVNFNFLSSPSNLTGYDLFFNDFSKGLLYSYFNGILKTDNGGASWFNSSGINLYSAIQQPQGLLTNVNGLIYTVRGGNIFKSVDQGTTFFAEFSPGCGNINAITTSEKPENNFVSVYVISNNGFVFKADFPVVGINNISSLLPDNFSLSQNYPNPFNPTTKIKFDIKESGFVKLKIYDMLGKEVASLVNEKLTPGSYETDFDGSGLTSGVYFYKLEAEGYNEVKRMMLVK